MIFKKTLPICAMLVTLLAVSASAQELTIEAPSAGNFARPTSDETVYIHDDPNQDLSKDTAVVPQPFGYSTSPAPGTPLNPYAATWGTTATGQTVSVPLTTTIVPTVTTTTWTAPSYTSVTSDLYYSGGYLGMLSIPSIGLSVKVYEGTDSSDLLKGAGHFENTSIWNGNASFAGHNRGVNNHFGQIHTLDAGDTITLTTKLGTRTYAVESVYQVNEMDNSMLAATAENRITLITCVRDQPELRWCVRAVEMK